MQSGTGERRGDLARSGALSMAGAAISAIMGLLLVLVLGRALGAEGAGVVLQAIAAFSIALGIGRGGLDTTAVWLLPRLGIDRHRELRPALSVVLAGALVLGILAALVMAAVGVLQMNLEPTVGHTLIVMSGFMPIAAMATVALAATRGFGGVRPYVLISSMGMPAIRPLLVIGVVAVGWGAMGAAMAWAAPFVIALLITLVILARQLRRAETAGMLTEITWRADRDLRRRITAYSMPRWLSAILEQLMLWVDVILVGALAGPVAAGIYGAATRFVAAGRIVSTAFRLVVAPSYSRLLAQGHTSQVQEIYATTTKWIVFFTAPAFAVYALFGQSILGLLGSEFREGAHALLILAAGLAVSILGGNIQSILLMSGNSGWVAINKAISLVLLVVGICILTPWLGVVGAAIAWSIAMLVDLGLAAVQVERKVGVRVLGLGPLQALAVGFGFPAVLMVGPRILIGDTAAGLALGLLLGGLGWLGACVIFRRRLELDGVGRLLRRRG